MLSLNTPDKTVETGETNLGKYTFPKIPAFALKVEEVPVKHVWK